MIQRKRLNLLRNILRINWLKWGETLKKGMKIQKVSRKQLADPRNGMSYNERLKRTKVEVKRVEFNFKEHGNGYATLVRLD